MGHVSISPVGTNLHSLASAKIYINVEKHPFYLISFYKPLFLNNEHLFCPPKDEHLHVCKF